jgi:hypothetical protein
MQLKSEGMMDFDKHGNVKVNWPPTRLAFFAICCLFWVGLIAFGLIQTFSSSGNFDPFDEWPIESRQITKESEAFKPPRFHKLNELSAIANATEWMVMNNQRRVIHDAVWLALLLPALGLLAVIAKKLHDISRLLEATSDRERS